MRSANDGAEVHKANIRTDPSKRDLTERSVTPTQILSVSNTPPLLPSLAGRMGPPIPCSKAPFELRGSEFSAECNGMSVQVVISKRAKESERQAVPHHAAAAPMDGSIYMSSWSRKWLLDCQLWDIF